MKATASHVTQIYPHPPPTPPSLLAHPSQPPTSKVQYYWIHLHLVYASKFKKSTSSNTAMQRNRPAMHQHCKPTTKSRTRTVEKTHQRNRHLSTLLCTMHQINPPPKLQTHHKPTSKSRKPMEKMICRSSHSHMAEALAKFCNKICPMILGIYIINK